MKWTNEQAAAINARGENLLVSAAAGSGKTALLIERILRLILDDGITTDRLLVLTFTKAAAGEMRERLRKALKQAAVEAESEERRLYLTRQIAALSDAEISTIHAFCKNVVSDYFELADIDAGFGICKEALSKKLQDEAMDNVFDRMYAAHYQKGNTAFTDLLEAYTDARSDEGLRTLVGAMHNFKESLADPETWFEDAINRMTMSVEAFHGSSWEKMFCEDARSEALEARRLLTLGLEFCDGAEGFEKISALIECEIAQSETLIDACAIGYDAVYQALQDLSFKRYPANRKNKEASNAVKAYRDAAKDILKKAIPAVITTSAEKMLARQGQMAEPMRHLYNLTSAFENEFFDLKKQMNVLDFHDLERKALSILSDPAVAVDLRRRFTAVFVDEYQDTNALQEAILTKIVREDNYFMVGDVKQSIYRFRLADPTIFLEKYERFGKGEAPKSRLITLSKNFRSNTAVIDGVNAIFERVMSKTVGEVAYDEGARLYPGVPVGGDPGTAQIHLIEAGDDPLDETEAGFIAKTINEMIGKPIYIAKEGHTRKLRYRDIGVLMRSVESHGKTYEKVLSDAGIPVYFSGGASYFDAVEVQTVMRLIALLDNPHDDYSLLSVMLSPIGGFDAEDIARVRVLSPKSAFYLAADAARCEPGELANRLDGFFEKINRLREVSTMMPADDFIWYILSKTGYYTAVGALPGGAQRRQNLKTLCAQARDYKASSLYGVFGFGEYVRHLQRQKFDETQPDTLSESDDVVRVMTIHKSKGLEFPVVFVAGCARKINKDNHSKEIIYHKDLGIVPKYTDINRRLRMSTPFYEMALKTAQNESLSEEMRLLYVAATRAMARLYIVGTATAKTFDDLEQSADTPASPYRIAHASTMMEWVLTAARNDERNTIHVYRHQLDHYEKAEQPTETKTKIDEAMCARLLNPAYLNKRIAFPGKLGVTSVTRVREATKGRVFAEPERIVRPAFLSAEGSSYDAAALGTALHAMMQGIDLSALARAWDNATLAETVASEVARMTKARIVEPDLAEFVDISMITQFFAFPEKGKSKSIGRRLLSAEQIMREQPFNLRVRASHVREDWPSDKTIILQGIIDCVFYDEDKKGWVLLDYKTDRVNNRGHLAKLTEHYQTQLMFYDEALAASGRKTAECYLCFLTIGENVAVTAPFES